MVRAKKLTLILGSIGAVILLLLFLYERETPSSNDETIENPATTISEEASGDVTTSTGSVSAEVSREPVKLPAVEILKLSESEQSRWQVFEELIHHQNDNDPRIDKNLKNLTPALRTALKNTYSSLENERRSERGFIVYLLSRELNSAEDLQFLKKVYEEPPCYSFERCDLLAESDPHLAGINEVSLNYPQLVGLYQLDQRLSADASLLENPAIKDEARNLIRAALQHPIPAVQARAREIQNKFNL